MSADKYPSIFSGQMEAITYMLRAFPDNAIDTLFSLSDPHVKTQSCDCYFCLVSRAWGHLESKDIRSPYPCTSLFREYLQVEGQEGE